MESTEEEFSSFTTKGRRTKRQRPILAASGSSSFRDGVGGGVSGGSSDNVTDVSSSSDEHDVMSKVTATEEEDMANCLILLAQGVQKLKSTNLKSKSIKKNPNTTPNTNTNNNIITSTTTSTSNNNNIIGHYECKTCNKTFTSFQALGGHRTSHKKIIKPAPLTLELDRDRDRGRGRGHGHDRDDALVVDHDHDDDDDHVDRIIFTSSKKMLFGHEDNTNNNSNSNIKARVHECSICGSEFPSGQALGGHMRRHRAASTAANSNNRPMTDSAGIATSASTVVIDTGGPRNILSLDLNLPAPDDQDDQHHVDEDDDHMENTKFVHHVLPRPAPLVDCHY